MKLHNNWKLIMRKAWSLRLIALAGVFSGVDAILPYFVDSIPRGLFSGLAMFSAVGGAIARIIAQPESGL